MGVGLGEAGGADWGRGEPPDSMQQTLYLYNKKKSQILEFFLVDVTKRVTGNKQKVIYKLL